MGNKTSTPVDFSVHKACEVRYRTVPGGQYTRMLLIQESRLYYAVTDMPSSRLRALQNITWKDPPRQIDLSRVLPDLQGDMTTCPNPRSKSIYTKTCNFLGLGEDMFKGSPPSCIKQREINTCEFLRENPHRNICAYKGVFVEDRRVFGLCFEKYEMSLYDLVKKDMHFSADKALKDIERGIDHLHTLGIAHCDIKPQNILTNSTHDRFVIADFDSCHKIGAKLTLKVGTRGWTCDRFEYANRENDFHGLSMIRFWLENKGWGAPLEDESYLKTEEILEQADVESPDEDVEGNGVFSLFRLVDRHRDHVRRYGLRSEGSGFDS